jgi:hypothetical protein
VSEDRLETLLHALFQWIVAGPSSNGLCNATEFAPRNRQLVARSLTLRLAGRPESLREGEASNFGQLRLGSVLADNVGTVTRSVLAVVRWEKVVRAFPGM